MLRPVVTKVSSIRAILHALETNASLQEVRHLWAPP